MNDDNGEPLIDVLNTTAAGPVAIRGSALRSVGYGIGLLLSLIAAPLLIRHLGNVEFGRYTLVLSVIALVAGLTEGGVGAVGLREYTVRTGIDRDILMRNLLGVRIALTLLGVGIAVAFTVVAGYDRVLVAGTGIAGAGLLVQVVQDLIEVPLAGNLRFGWATATDLLRQTVSVALTIALIVVGASLLPFLAVSIPAGLAALVVTATLVRRAMPFRPAFDRSEWWLLTRETLPYAAAIGLNVAYFRLAIIIMSLASTAAQTGFFSISFRIMEVLLPIPALAVEAVFPIVARAARDDPDRLAYATQRIFEVAVILGGWLVLCIELAAPFIIRVLAGSHAGPSVPVLRLQGLALVATFVAVGCGFPLLSLRRHRDLLIANAFALAFSVGLTLLLVPLLNAEGAAIATACAEWVLAIVTATLLGRARRELRPKMRALGAPVLALIPALSTIYLPTPSVVRALVGSVIYAGILGLWGRVPPEMLEALIGPISRR